MTGLTMQGNNDMNTLGMNNPYGHQG